MTDKHAHWKDCSYYQTENTKDGDFICFVFSTCSSCGEEVIRLDTDPKHTWCPYCGARMDEEANCSK